MAASFDFIQKIADRKKYFYFSTVFNLFLHLIICSYIAVIEKPQVISIFSACRYIPKDEFRIQQHAHRGPLSKLVTTTTPCNPFNKTMQTSQLTSGLFII